MSRGALKNLHIISVAVGFIILAFSLLWNISDTFSMVNNTLFTIKVIISAIAALNGLGYFILVHQKIAKHKTFSLVTFPLAIVASTFVIYVVIVLLGAPLISKVSETFHLACLISACTSFPLIMACQRDWDMWLRIVFVMKNRLNAFEWDLFFCSIFPLVGALLGSAFIPLDWDRPWQQWPITPSVGAIFGFLVGHVFSLIRVSPVISSKASKWK